MQLTAAAQVPEPSTWAMTLGGFAGLGWLARMRRRKTWPA
jgi:PEP-CTERM motif